MKNDCHFQQNFYKVNIVARGNTLYRNVQKYVLHENCIIRKIYLLVSAVKSWSFITRVEFR